MTDTSKTKTELIEELEKVRADLAKSENMDSERKKAEVSYMEQHGMESQYLDIAGVMIVAINASGEVTLINRKGCEVLGYAEEEILGKNWFENFLPENIRKVVVPISKKLLAGEIEPVEYFENPVLTRSGEERLIAWHNTILKDKAGKIIGTLSSGDDITERKRDENLINKSLKEKEVLLKEIHHRVKNNLQVVSSILNIQSGFIEDIDLKEIFRESQDRIRSMALVHEQLYQSKDFTNISSSEYLRALITNIFNSYYLSVSMVDLDTHIEDISLDIDTSMLLGLLLNELCSNALKYAFPEGRRGELKVDFKKVENDKCRLVVSDNGVGLPDGFDIEKTDSMGFLLVNSMTEQINGTLKIDQMSGTSFEIVFPLL